jgi:hypothetical protein
MSNENECEPTSWNRQSYKGNTYLLWKLQVYDFAEALLHSLINYVNPFDDCELYNLKSSGLYHLAF